MVQTALEPHGGPYRAPDMTDGLSRVSKMAEDPGQQRRLRTFSNWPLNAPVPKDRLAQAGFEHIGDHSGDLRTMCRSCGLVISDWQYADCVIQRHRDASPNCLIVQSLPTSPPPPPPPSVATQEPSVGGARSQAAEDASRPMQVDCVPPSSQRAPTAESDLFLQRLKASEEARFDTFSDWPLDFLSPRVLAQAGFYYIHEGDKVRCAFCRGVVYGWEAGDDPLREHARHYPCCPFLLNPELAGGHDECGHESWHRARSRPEGGAGGQALLANGGPGGVQLKAPMTQLSKLGVAVHVGPKHPSQASPDARMRSFEKWPSTCPKRPSELVVAGFFYIGLQDYTKCFHCDGGLCNWDAADDPWEEHARWFPRCQFVLLSKGEAYIEQCLARHRSHLNSVAAATSTSGERSGEDEGMATELATLMQSDDVKFYLSQGVPVETLRVALLQHMRAQSRGFASRDELLQVLGELLALPRSSSGRAAVERSSSAEDATTPSKPSSLTEEHMGGVKVVASTSGKASSSLPSEPTELALENLRLKEQRLCKVCLDAEVGVVFLPCGHLVACPACASALTACPICRKAIAGTVRTFLS